MEGGMKGPGDPQGPGKSDKSSLENSAELKKSAERFCSTTFNNTELTEARKEFVTKAFDGKDPERFKMRMRSFERSLHLPEAVSIMVWVGAPKQLQAKILREHHNEAENYLAPARDFKNEAVEKFGNTFTKDQWEILTKVAKGFWEIKLDEYPIKGVTLPESLENKKKQLESARIWASSNIPDKNDKWAYPLYKTGRSGMRGTKEGKYFGDELEEVYGAFIKQYATDPKARAKLFKELDFKENSKELENEGYFETLESSFFSPQNWGEKLENTEEAKALLSKDVLTGIPPKTLDYYLLGISKRYNKPGMAYFVEYLKEHPNVSWSSLAIMNESSLSTGWFAGGRSASSIETLINSKFSEPIIKDMHDTDRAFMRMPLKDMMSMLPDRDRADVDVFIAKTMNERFKDSGGTENQPIDHIYSELLVRYGRVLPEKGSTGALKAIVALHGGRAKYLETFLGVNIAPFEHIQRTLVKIEHMAEQARLAPDVATKNHFALRARMMLLEDFDEYTKELQTHMPIPDEYAKIYKGRLYKITEDLEEAERQLRVAGI